MSKYFLFRTIANLYLLNGHRYFAGSSCQKLIKYDVYIENYCYTEYSNHSYMINYPNKVSYQGSTCQGPSTSKPLKVSNCLSWKDSYGYSDDYDPSSTNLMINYIAASTGEYSIIHEEYLQSSNLINDTARPSLTPTASPTALPTITRKRDWLFPDALIALNMNYICLLSSLAMPTMNPSPIPTANPSISLAPSYSMKPSAKPSQTPTITPSSIPTFAPSPIKRTPSPTYFYDYQVNILLSQVRLTFS